MLNVASAPRVLQAAGMPLLVLAILATGGCASTGADPVAARARQVYRETTGKNPDFAIYALSIAQHSEAPAARDLVVSSIRSDHFATALEAVRSLGEQLSPEVRAGLEQVFASKRGALRLMAAAVLARAGDEEARSWLKQEVVDKRGTFNVQAIVQLAQQGEGEALRPLLAERMKNDDLGIRDEVYGILGEIKQPWATRLLLEGFENERGEDRKQAIVALGRTADPDVAAKIQPFTNTKGLVFSSIEALGALGNPVSIPHLKTKTGHDSKLVRIYAGVALWRLGEQAVALETLEPLVDDEDATVRHNLAEQLGLVDSVGTTELLRRLARDEEKAVQISAVRSLIGRRSADVEALMVEEIGDPDYEVSTLALAALARTGGPGTVTSIEPLLADQNPYVALSAANAILAIRARGAA